MPDKQYWVTLSGSDLDMQIEIMRNERYAYPSYSAKPSVALRLGLSGVLGWDLTTDNEHGEVTATLVVTQTERYTVLVSAILETDGNMKHAMATAMSRAWLKWQAEKDV